MPQRHAGALANPLVGIYFGILASCLAAGVVLLLIMEQLGFAEASLRLAMGIIAVTLFVSIGVAAYTRRVREFLMAARRVPSFYNGLAIAIVTPGGAGLTAMAGALFLAGFDTLCLGIGMIAGLTVSLMLIAPFLRKFGAPTVSSYLGQRFESGPLRLLAASVTVVPLMLLALAEVKVAILAAGWLMPLPAPIAASIVALLLVSIVVPGGARSLSWSSAAQALLVVAAIVLPAAIAAVMETNLPFGLLSHGPVLRSVSRVEALQEIPVPVAGLWTFDLPDPGLQPIVGRFATTFGTVGPIAFVLTALSVLAGVAASPPLIARSVTAPSVYETRKSIGWAVALLGVILLTFSSVAVFQREVLLTTLVGQPAVAPPATLQRLIEMGLAAVEPKPAKLAATSILFDRDGMLVALPVLMGMPLAVVNLVAAGVLAAALAGAAASVTQIGIIIGEDVVNAPAAERADDGHRLTVCRLAILAAAVLAGLGAVLAGGDPLMLVLHAFAVSGSSLFPVIALSVWWKRTTAVGAMAGLAAGFVIALAIILVADLTPIGLAAPLAPAIAMPFAIAATLLISHLTPAPGRHILELVRDLRVPGGETIYDREARQRGTRRR